MLTLATALVAGCDEGLGGFGAKSAGDDAVELVDATASPKPQKPSKGDVEAPDIFSTTDEALWDGRPSLGGIWVAAPDAVNPERVIIRNDATGKSVTGALFRRERENPGPALQISSDAAAALGMLAGQPGKISVVALSRARPDPVAEPAADVEAETVAEPEAATEVVTAAGAAINAAEDGVVGDTPPAVAEDTMPAQAVAPAAPKKGFLGGLFKPRKPKSDVAVPLTAIAPTPGDPLPDASAAPGAAATGEIETAPIDALPVNAAPPTAKAAYRYAIGAFSVEANADTAVAALTKAGLAATIEAGQSGGKPIWAVYASGTGDKAGALAKIKALGFKDAYALK